MLQDWRSPLLATFNRLHAAKNGVIPVNLRIQFLSFPGCPNADPARAALEQALDYCGLPVHYEDVDVMDHGTPEALKGWGSPTILVNGADVAGGKPSDQTSCRIYENGTAPDSDQIAIALRAAMRNERH